MFGTINGESEAVTESVLPAGVTVIAGASEILIGSGSTSESDKSKSILELIILFGVSVTLTESVLTISTAITGVSETVIESPGTLVISNTKLESVTDTESSANDLVGTISVVKLILLAGAAAYVKLVNVLEADILFATVVRDSKVTAAYVNFILAISLLYSPYHYHEQYNNTE